MGTDFGRAAANSALQRHKSFQVMLLRDEKSESKVPLPSDRVTVNRSHSRLVGSSCLEHRSRCDWPQRDANRISLYAVGCRCTYFSCRCVRRQQVLLLVQPPSPTASHSDTRPWMRWLTFCVCDAVPQTKQQRSAIHPSASSYQLCCAVPYSQSHSVIISCIGKDACSACCSYNEE